MKEVIVDVYADDVLIGHAKGMYHEWEDQGVKDYGLRSKKEYHTINFKDFDPFPYFTSNVIEKMRWGIQDETNCIHWCDNEQAARAVFKFLKEGCEAEEGKEYRLVRSPEEPIFTVETTQKKED